MKRTALVARSLLSLLGVTLTMLGGLFWVGRALSLVPLHMLLGVAFTLCLWVLVLLAFVARAGRGLALLVLVWSLIVPALGVGQLHLLLGSLHWVIQSTHLVVGFIAMGLGHALGRAIPREAAVAGAVPEHA